MLVLNCCHFGKTGSQCNEVCTAKRARGLSIYVTVVCDKRVTVKECAIGGLQKCHKFMCSGDTF